MRLISYFIVFLLIITTISAQDFNDYENLEIEARLSSKLNLEYLESDYRLDYVTANLTFFPRNNEFQSTKNKFTSKPSGKINFNDNFILYRWENVGDNEIEYELTSNLNTRTNFKIIRERIKFPLNEEDIKNLEEYTEESITITSNDPDIRKKASELAEGEDDLFVVVHKIASWTKQNINYSLETLTAEVSQDASWVFDNRKGVCDELTSLFVAMLRSINIPARFVTGQAYTNVIDGFGNHAWAEVYFPGHGWVAFDPTYGQMGYVDSTHITMRDSLDVRESSVNYAWRSYGVDISADKLNIESNVTRFGSLYKEDVKLSAELLQKEVGAGSYVPLKIEVQNLNDYYLPLNLNIIKAPKSLDDRERNVLLKPGERRNIFFVIQVPDDLEKGFVYTSDIEIIDQFKHSALTNIKFGREYGIYTLEEALEKISQLKEEDKKIYSANIRASCSKEKEFYYPYENIRLSCSAKNIGNVNLKDLDLCYLNRCSKISLDIGEEKVFGIEVNDGEIEKELALKLENSNVNKNIFIDLGIINLPNLNVINLSYPEHVGYFDKDRLAFTLTSDSEAKDVVVKFGSRKVFDIPSLKGNNDFSIDFRGYSFYDKRSDLLISYKDLNDKSYSLTQEVDVKVESLPFFIKYFGFIIIILLIIISMIFQKKLRR
ncbi:MAG: Transglutaminase protein [archaeon GW2011_AR20]|nr:MAG: Transglutaminase protein [archaeon GW2011_AR20]MBS3161057.1 transglutaminase domain-containing protein [Candidatus Woesearchaeota archaeon]